jgi:hypothetical protein
MPVIKRKLASSAPINLPQIDQRSMKVIPAAKYLGTSASQIRKFIREGVLKPYRIANKQYLDRYDLDALIERLKAPLSIPVSPTDGPRLLKIPEAAVYLRRSPWFVRQLIATGQLKIVGPNKPFLIDRINLDMYVDQAKRKR